MSDCLQHFVHKKQMSCSKWQCYTKKFGQPWFWALKHSKRSINCSQVLSFHQKTMEFWFVVNNYHQQERKTMSVETFQSTFKSICTHFATRTTTDGTRSSNLGESRNMTMWYVLISLCAIVVCQQIFLHRQVATRTLRKHPPDDCISVCQTSHSIHGLPAQNWLGSQRNIPGMKSLHRLR